MHSNDQASKRGGRPDLSEREEQVLRMKIAGLTLKDIARRLGVRYATADSYRRRLFEKFSVGSSSELVAKGVRMGYEPWEG